MARARQRSSSASGGARATSRKATRTQEVEVIEEKPGFGFEEGIIFITTLVLLVAFFMIDHARGSYGEGMFFK